MKKFLPALALIFLMVTVVSCASSIKSFSENYSETVTAVKDFSVITSKDWLFGSGVIRGALPTEVLPSWVYDELDKVDEWFTSSNDLTDSQLGYIVGIRLRLAGPIIKAAINQYAPGILSIAEVSAVLAFIGL